MEKKEQVKVIVRDEEKYIPRFCHSLERIQFNPHVSLDEVMTSGLLESKEPQSFHVIKLEDDRDDSGEKKLTILLLVRDRDEHNHICYDMFIQRVLSDENNQNHLYDITQYRGTSIDWEKCDNSNIATAKYRYINKDHFNFKNFCEHLRVEIGDENLYKLFSYMRNNNIELAAQDFPNIGRNLYLKTRINEDGDTEFCNYSLDENHEDKWIPCRKIFNREYNHEKGIQYYMPTNKLNNIDIEEGHDVANVFSSSNHMGREDMFHMMKVTVSFIKRHRKERICDTLCICKAKPTDPNSRFALYQFMVYDGKWIEFLDPYTMTYKVYDNNADLIHSIKQKIGENNTFRLLTNMYCKDIILF